MTRFVWREKLPQKAIKSKKGLFYLVDSRVVAASETLSMEKNKYVVESWQSNTLETYNEVITTMLKRKMDRSTTLVVVGGGMLHDLGGFIASTYLRGVNWIYVPTSLMGMADSCVGGRCGLRYDGKDCAIGASYAPSLVVLDYSLLGGLPQSEWLGGVCEIIRTGLTSKKMLEYLEQNVYALLSRDKTVTVTCLEMCRKIKRRVISSRRFKPSKSMLKVGRTLGLALEYVDGKSRSRGEYLLLGTVLEMSVLKSAVQPSYFDRAMRLMDKTALQPLDFSVEEVVAKCFEYSSTGVITMAIPRKCGAIAIKRVDEATLLSGLNYFKTE